MGQQGEHNQDCAHNHKGNLQVFGGRVENLIRDKAAHRASQHFQAVLVDDSIDSHQRCRKGISFLQEGDKIGQSAVYTVHKEYIKGYQPDVFVF